MNRLARSEQETSPLSRWGLGNDIDRVFEGFFRPMRMLEEATSENFMPSMDVTERDNEFVVRTDLPGVKKEDINVTLENGVLTITAQCQSDAVEKDGERVIRKERRAGQYARSLRLGTQIDEKAVTANYRDGVLELRLPKAEAAKPKRISVDVG